MTALFANNSNIWNIHIGAFEKLQMLKILNLQQNYIEQIESNTFKSVSNLKELYLQDNQIHSIENDSFLDVFYLKTLKLHGNNLQYLNVSLFAIMNSLTEVTLSGNPWFCNCHFGPAFQKWLRNHQRIVTDIDYIYCMNDLIYTPWEVNGQKTRGTRREFINSTLMNAPLIYIDFSNICNNVSTIEYRYINSITGITSLAAAFGIFMLIVIVVHKNLLLIKVWVYNRFGVRFHHEENDNAEKPYDVFVTYARQDESFVVQHLLPELEEGDMSYRVGIK